MAQRVLTGGRSPDESALDWCGNDFPIYSRAEKFADGCVHALSVAASVTAVTILLIVAAPISDAGALVCLAIYGLALVLVFACSAAYNMFDASSPVWKEWMRRVDHAAIFVKISGTYTPFAALCIGGSWGVALMVTVWSITLVGVPLKLIGPKWFIRRTVWLYLAQGWVVLFAIGPLSDAVPLGALILIGVGGVLYSVGVIFHRWEALPYHNAIWHLFVLAASACMFAAVVNGVSGTAWRPVYPMELIAFWDSSAAWAATMAGGSTLDTALTAAFESGWRALTAAGGDVWAHPAAALLHQAAFPPALDAAALFGR